MTKLEEEIRAAIDAIPLIDNGSAGLPHLYDDYNSYAKAAAEVAKKYIEKAFNSGMESMGIKGDGAHIALLKQWLKENGITE